MNPVLELPSWFKQEIPDSATLNRIRLLSESKINTVCQQAHCPNLSRCFKNRQLTFMILGDTCTRNCRFCTVKKTDEKSLVAFDIDEADRIARTVKELDLDYAVITSVTRDDIPDGGAKHFIKTIKSIQSINENIKIEILIPDFSGNPFLLETIVRASPTVIAHNLETVRRLSGELRPQADYLRSLNVLKTIKEINASMVTKSSLMLGLGESEQEVIGAMEDLSGVGCDILTLGQYLAPSPGHYPVKEFISAGQFIKYRNIAVELGFKAVLSGPLVRSSYKARELYGEALCMT